MKALEFAEKLKNPKKYITAKDLAKQLAVRNHDIPLFAVLLGAGASASSGISTSQDLIRTWRRDIYLKLSKKNDAVVPSDIEIINWLKANEVSWYNENNEYPCLFEWHYKMPRLRQKFVEEMIEGKYPSIGYAFIVRLIEKKFFGPVFTTNFDDLMNEAFHLFSEHRPIVCAHDSAILGLSLNAARPKIIKLHGDYLFNNIKCSPSDLNTLEKNMKDKFQTFLNEFGLLVCGYSGRDQSILKIIKDRLDDHVSLEYGLYWAFRPNDEISSDVQEIIKNDKSFIIISDGFDELFAELYSIIVGSTNPLLTNDLAFGSQNKVIRSYMSNNLNMNQQNEFIKGCFAEIKRMVTSSELSRIMQSINTENNDDFSYKDEDMVRLLRIEQLIIKRDFNSAIESIEKELGVAKDINIKKGLIRRLCACKNQILDKSGAIEAADQLMVLEPENFNSLLLKVSVLGETALRIEEIKKYIKDVDENYLALNRYALELIKINDNSIKDEKRSSEILSLLDKSISRHPVISNRAYKIKFNFILDNNSKNIEENLLSVINSSLQQLPFDFRTLDLIYSYCKYKEMEQFNNRDFLNLATEAYSKHYPKEKAKFFTLMTNACIEFGRHHLIGEICKLIGHDDSIYDDEVYIVQVMKLQYDVFRDLNGSIEIGKNYISRIKSEEVEEILLEYLILDNRHQEAEALLEKIKVQFEDTAYHKYNSDLMASKGLYQNAIDELMLIKDREFFDSKYSSKIAYYYLKMGDFQKAKDQEVQFLKTVDFGIVHTVDLVNYEIAKFSLKAELSKKRLNDILAYTKDKVTKGVVLILLNDREEGEKILKAEAEKRFSKLDLFIEWPALLESRKTLIEFKDYLLANKRELNFKVTSSKLTQI